jgi:hypothetical protein
MNYFVKRSKPYNPIGRLQTETESDELAAHLIGFLIDNNVEHSVIFGNIEEYDKVIQEVSNKLKEINK